uniref:G_PROTEIN_RECEP_F1_2 domain-containing protein n=1 Tax=Strongyloides venezuelensis TaxID=75913 RepID=A0A0K0F2V7_STRVS
MVNITSIINPQIDGKNLTQISLNNNNYQNNLNPAPITAIIFGIFTIIAIILNISLFCYIILQRLYQNFISSHFIAHLCITNLVCLLLLMPLFLYSVFTGQGAFENFSFMCKLQSLLACSVWTVVQLMVLCISGVHLLTFARIHYEQLFGLPPNILCGLSWLISLSLSLPCVTNSDVVRYDEHLRQCIWGSTDSAYKFLTYILIFGMVIPCSLSSYAYIRVLGILYHSPIVFQSIGLYKSRFLVYAFLASPFYTLPIFVVSIAGTDKFASTPWVPILSTFTAYFQSIISPILYGSSLFLMKEEDMALTARAHKAGPNSYQPVQLQVPGQHL